MNLEEFQKLSRREKRSLIVDFGGKKMSALKYCQIIAKSLSPCVIKSTGVALDHKHNIRKVYYDSGLDGINNYVKMINEVVADEADTYNDPNRIPEKLGWYVQAEGKVDIRWENNAEGVSVEQARKSCDVVSKETLNGKKENDSNGPLRDEDSVNQSEEKREQE